MLTILSVEFSSIKYIYQHLSTALSSGNGFRDFRHRNNIVFLFNVNYIEIVELMTIAFNSLSLCN